MLLEKEMLAGDELRTILSEFTDTCLVKLDVNSVRRWLNPSSSTA